MAVNTSYPGVYIQELPSLVHSITPSPTSIAVFVGYTHPFRTPEANQLTAIQLFSFADYQANFGGFFSSPWLARLRRPGGLPVLPQRRTELLRRRPAGPPVLQRRRTPPSRWQPGGRGRGDGRRGRHRRRRSPSPRCSRSGSRPPRRPPARWGSRCRWRSPTCSRRGTNDTADIVISYGTTVETYRQVPIANIVRHAGSRPSWSR